MFIKEAVMNASRRFFLEKDVAFAQDNLILQFLFFTTLKNYFYSWITQQKPLLIPNDIKAKAAKNKIILVLDMDQTLVYTRRRTPPNHCNYIRTQFQGQDMYVQPRPYAKRFLESLSEVFTLYIYTAGKKKYADTVLKVIDPKNLIEKRFYRDSCKKQNGILIKDLKYLKKVLKTKQEMILVDDNTLSVETNYPFAINIEAFQGNQADQGLLITFEKVLKFYI